MRVFCGCIAALLFGSNLAFAEMKIVASIKPIHSLVSMVMAGVGTPSLIVDGSNSPHTYAMKPSDASALEQAQVIFWVGPGLETFLEKPLESLGHNATIVPLIAMAGMQTLPVRQNESFETHEDGKDHQHEGTIDGHVWLDPSNARAMLKTIAETLSKSDPAHSTLFTANADSAAVQLETLESEITTTLQPVKGKSFIVFHDAYQYFEHRFDLVSNGAIAIHPENTSGAKHIANTRKRITVEKINCVFAEPQFDNKLVTVILEGTQAKSAVLDPLGASLEPGPLLYETLLRNIASNLKTCLTY